MLRLRRRPRRTRHLGPGVSLLPRHCYHRRRWRRLQRVKIETGALPKTAAEDSSCLRCNSGFLFPSSFRKSICFFAFAVIRNWARNFFCFDGTCVSLRITFFFPRFFSLKLPLSDSDTIITARTIINRRLCFLSEKMCTKRRKRVFFYNPPLQSGRLDTFFINENRRTIVLPSHTHEFLQPFSSIRGSSIHTRPLTAAALPLKNA